jgi:hypothetical protein
MQLVDGGTFSNIAISDPIRRCQEEEGAKPSDIIIDVIVCLSAKTELDAWDYD